MKTGWLVGVVLLSSAFSLTEATGVKGFDCWVLGMTKDEVKACIQHRPYVDVKVTGGLETANGEFEGKKTNISFVFQNDHLAKIQVWLCEQADIDTAVSAATRAWQYLSREFGPIALAGTNLSSDVTVEDFRVRVYTLAAGLSTDKQDKFQLGPVNKPDGAAVWSSVLRDPKYGYYVFLYFAEP